MGGRNNQVFEKKEVMLMGFGNEALTQKMLKMKSPLDESLKTKGEKKCSG
jgi:hypothetical protein